ncbi:hypothetical protein MACH16_00280 [Marinomonas pontica]|uniref:Preprotein translocase subunit SecB n=1 Tax=Marinomonas pontica TaxID=264739 RepID=A0ABM8F8N9_9GAMM|nr:hypothetical protein MACH16_00280 [Marinomonas pontica]
MATKNSVSLQKAIDNLSIQDVYLKSSQAECSEGFDPKRTEHTELLVQQMHIVRGSEILQTNEGNLILKVYVRLGTRWGMPVEGSEPEVKALVEADFIAEYTMAELLETEAVDEFSLKNASFHVWPYWREFLSSQCERLRLPRLILPAVQFNR